MGDTKADPIGRAPSGRNSRDAAARSRVGRRFRDWIGESGSTRRVLFRNGVWTFGVYVFQAGVLFFLTPFVVRSLGSSMYGTWEVLGTLTGYMSLADFGIKPAIVYFVARHDVRGELHEVNRYVSSACATFSVGGAMTIAAGAAILTVFPDWFQVPAGSRSQASVALALSVLTLAITLPANAFSAVLIGKQRFDLSARVDLVVSAMRYGGVIYVLTSGGGIVGLAVVHLVVAIIDIGWKALLAFRVQPGLHPSRSLVTWPACRALLLYGALNLLVVGGATLIFGASAVVIGTALGVESVAFFAVGAKLPQQVKGMVESVGRILAPTMGALHARGDRQAVARLIAEASRTFVFLAGPVVVYLLCLGPSFLERWMGGGVYREKSGPVLAVMTVAMAAHAAAFPLTAMHQGSNWMRSLAAFSLIEGVANVTLSLWLVHPLGILGVALGTAIPAVVVRVFLMPSWTCRAMGTPFGTFLLRLWPVPLAAGAVTYFGLRALVDPRAPQSWPALVGFALLTAAVFGALALAAARALARPSR